MNRQIEVDQARNEKITNELGKQKSAAQRNLHRYENERDKRKACEKNKTEWLFKVPFIDVGVTVSFARGFGVGFIAALVIL